jgi:hypothetical protein
VVAKRWTLLPAVVLFLVESGLQISGFHNLWVAIALWGAAALLVLVWLIYGRRVEAQVVPEKQTTQSFTSYDQRGGVTGIVNVNNERGSSDV